MVHKYSSFPFLLQSFNSAPGNENMKDLAGDAFVEGLGNPQVENTVREKEPVILHPCTQHCHETVSPTHFASASTTVAEDSVQPLTFLVYEN